MLLPRTRFLQDHLFFYLNPQKIRELAKASPQLEKRINQTLPNYQLLYQHLKPKIDQILQEFYQDALSNKRTSGKEFFLEDFEEIQQKMADQHSWSFYHLRIYRYQTNWLRYIPLINQSPKSLMKELKKDMETLLKEVPRPDMEWMDDQKFAIAILETLTDPDLFQPNEQEKVHRILKKHNIEYLHPKKRRKIQE